MIRLYVCIDLKTVAQERKLMAHVGPSKMHTGLHTKNKCLPCYFYKRLCVGSSPIAK